jgi:hypothetical protein
LAVSAAGGAVGTSDAVVDGQGDWGSWAAGSIGAPTAADPGVIAGAELTGTPQGLGAAVAGGGDKSGAAGAAGGGAPSEVSGKDVGWVGSQLGGETGRGVEVGSRKAP